VQQESDAGGDLTRFDPSIFKVSSADRGSAHLIVRMTQKAPRRLMERKGQVYDRDQPIDGGLSASRIREGVSLVIYRLQVARTGLLLMEVCRGG